MKWTTDIEDQIGAVKNFLQQNPGSDFFS